MMALLTRSVMGQKTLETMQSERFKIKLQVSQEKTIKLLPELSFINIHHSLQTTSCFSFDLLYSLLLSNLLSSQNSAIYFLPLL